MLFNWLAGLAMCVWVFLCVVQCTCVVYHVLLCELRLRLHWHFVLLLLFLRRRFFCFVAVVVIVHVCVLVGCSTFNDEKILSTCCQKVKKEKIQRLFQFIFSLFDYNWDVFNFVKFSCWFFFVFISVERHNGRRRITVIFFVYGSSSWTISKTRARKGGRIIKSPIHRT